MFMGILIAFAIIFIIVLAFKPNTKTTKVIKRDEQGNEITEVHQTKETTAAGCAAKIVVWSVIIAIVVIIIVLMNVYK